MSDENMEIEESFAELLERSIKTLNTGEKVTGIVTNITPTEIYVDLGTKHAGYIHASEMTDNPAERLEDLVKVGDEIDAFVMRVNDQEGMVALSKKRLDSIKSWEKIEEARREKCVLEGYVTEENKGGIVANVMGVRVFIPAFQTGVPKGSPLSELIRTKVSLKITEVNRARRRVIGSMRAVQMDERKEKAAKVWEEIEVGKQYTGTVKSLTSYGAFVDIGGVDGMVHVSEISWSRIKNPSEVLNVGDTVTAFILSFDAEKGKISLSMKDRSIDPWSEFISKHQVGMIVPVKIVQFVAFGAFAEIIPGVDGLIHISQVSAERVSQPQDALTDGQVVDAKIIEINLERKKVSLSIRALSEEAAPEAEAEPECGSESFCGAST